MLRIVVGIVGTLLVLGSVIGGLEAPPRYGQGSEATLLVLGLFGAFMLTVSLFGGQIREYLHR